MKKCNQCQFEVDDDARFCKSCGKGFDEVKVENIQLDTSYSIEEKSGNNSEGDSIALNDSNNNPNSVVKKKRINKKLLLLGIIIIVLIISFFIVYSHYSKSRGALSVKKAVEQYIEALEDGDYFVRVNLSTFECDSDNYREQMSLAKVLDKEPRRYGRIKVHNINIIDKVKYSKEELKDIEDEIYFMYDFKVDVSKCYDITVSYEVSNVEGDLECEYNLIIGKVDGKWYVLNRNYYFGK